MQAKTANAAAKTAILSAPAKGRTAKIKDATHQSSKKTTGKASKYLAALRNLYLCSASTISCALLDLLSMYICQFFYHTLDTFIYIGFSSAAVIKF